MQTHATAEYTCNIVTFVFMLRQVTALTGGGKLPSEFTDAAAQTELLRCLQNVAYGPDIPLLLWVTSGPVLKFSHMTDESYMNSQPALHQTTPFHEGHFRCSWSMSPHYPQFPPGTLRDVEGPWLAPSNATTLQLHIKYIWGNQPFIVIQCRVLPHPEWTFPIC